MNNVDRNPYAPPVAPIKEVWRTTSAYPLGKLTIPWFIALNIGIGWAAGSLFTYLLSLYFSGHALPHFIEPLQSFPLVNDRDDLAGLLCYPASFAVSAILSARLASQAWPTWRLACPPIRPCVLAFIRSSLLLAPVWMIASWFFEVYRHNLPGDGNWPAIACLTGLASFHWFLAQKLIARMQVTEAETVQEGNKPASLFSASSEGAPLP